MSSRPELQSTLDFALANGLLRPHWREINNAARQAAREADSLAAAILATAGKLRLDPTHAARLTERVEAIRGRLAVVLAWLAEEPTRERIRSPEMVALVRWLVLTLPDLRAEREVYRKWMREDAL